MEDTASYFPSALAIIDSIGGPPTRSTVAKGWKGAQMCSWRGEIDICAYDAPDDILLAYHQGGSSRMLVSANPTGYASVSRPGLISILHGNSSVRWEVDGKFETLSLHISKEYFSRPPNADNICERLKSAPALAFKDDFVCATLNALATEMQSGEDDGGLFAESLVCALVAYIERNFCVGGGPPTPTFSNAALEVICNYIDRAVEARISVDGLAQLVDLPRAEFSRRFHLSTRKTPYQFVIERRVQMACELLRDTDEEICEIALRCGFSSQAHFSTTFKRTLDVTPAAYRRQFI